MTLALALLSGVPALVYQVAWTREIALLAGSQVEAISAVLVAFFGGLAVGARVWGGWVDRAGSPLAVYGALEVGAGGLAFASAWALPALDVLPSSGARLVAAVLVLLPATFLLGGTIPALLRAAAAELAAAPRWAGWLNGANTGGAVLGVGLAVALIPAWGLRATVMAAGAAAVLVGAAAIAWSRGRERPELAPPADPAPSRPLALAVAAVAGAATLGFEVLAARLCALVLGSSLYAWSAVLALVLTGLACGNALGARRAARSAGPARDLGWIEAAAALAIAWTAIALAPGLTTPAAGVSARSLVAVAAGILPAALCMGAAFPFFVRLAAVEVRLGAAFGGVSAANTAGGIAGALLAPFVWLPRLGLAGGMLACAGLLLAAGVGLLLTSAQRPRAAALRVAPLALLAALAWLRALAPPAVPAGQRILYVDHGRQASVVVVHAGDRRDLLVDGDREASTGGSGRRTEEMLAALPLLLHPDPHEFLEIGLGAGITLATAARFPIARAQAVEIADAVIRAAPYFAPDNGAPTTGANPRLGVLAGDGRIHVARHPGRYDVIAANTLQPWSVGATGLYSRQYFDRLAAALRADGIAVQWLPVEHIDAPSLAAILRTFFASFPHGGLWWGHGNVVAVGARSPLPAADPDRVARLATGAGLDPRVGLSSAAALAARRIAGAQAVRRALGDGPILVDDRPLLERRAAGRRRAGDAAAPLALLERIAAEAAREGPGGGAMRLWLEALRARAEGDRTRWLDRAALAEAAGLELAAEARRAELLDRARQALRAGDARTAERRFRDAAAEAAITAEARFGLGLLAYRAGDLDRAAGELRRALAADPASAEVWNLLGVVQLGRGEPEAAGRAFEAALARDPFQAEALANAGRLAAAAGDRRRARALLERLRASSPLGPTPQERALAERLTRSAEGP